MEENVQAIKRWERTILLARSKTEQVSDWIACTAGRGPVLVLHVLWFGVWVTVNAGMIHGLRPFDPFPFPFLTMTVSLEAIFLALFVLASQTLDVQTSLTPEQLRDLMKKTDLRRLTNRMEELAEPSTLSGS